MLNLSKESNPQEVQSLSISPLSGVHIPPFFRAMDNESEVRLRKRDACPEGLEWFLEQETPQQAWDGCERCDWMLWTLYVLETDSYRTIRHRMDDLARELSVGFIGMLPPAQHKIICDKIRELHPKAP